MSRMLVILASTATLTVKGSHGGVDLIIPRDRNASFETSIIEKGKTRLGATGFLEAINAVFPQADVQLCIVHMVRNSLKYVGYQERQKVAGVMV